MPVLENDLKKPEEHNNALPSLSNVLFDADKRSTEIIRTLSQENGQSMQPKQKKTQSQDMEMCF